MSDVDSRLSSPEGTRPRPDYRSKTNVKLKVLDFVKFGGGKRTPTQPDTSRNRPAEAPLRPPVIDGIEELDPTGRIEELD